MTQEKIVALMEEVKEKASIKEKPKKWNKYYGDMCVRIFGEFISKEIPDKYTLSSPNAYIEGFPTEFDLLIIDKDASPKKYTNAYCPKDVGVGIEIKARGIFGRRENLEKIIGNIKGNFDAVRNDHPRIDFVYLTYEEVNCTKRKGSIQYLDETIKILEPYKVFCLKESRTVEEIEGEWEKLVLYLNNSLQKGDS